MGGCEWGEPAGRASGFLLHYLPPNTNSIQSNQFQCLHQHQEAIKQNQFQFHVPCCRPLITHETIKLAKKKKGGGGSSFKTTLQNRLLSDSVISLKYAIWCLTDTGAASANVGLKAPKAWNFPAAVI